MAIGSARPAASVTSSKVPSPRFRSSDEPQGRLPGAAEEQDVEVAVVVEVGAGDVQGVDLLVQARAGRAVLEGAVAAVDEERGPGFGVEGGREQVGPAVAVEVVEDAAAGLFGPRRAETGGGGDVVEAAGVGLGAEAIERDAVLRRALARILTQRHVGDVQEPAHAQVVRADSSGSR